MAVLKKKKPATKSTKTKPNRVDVKIKNIQIIVGSIILLLVLLVGYFSYHAFIKPSEMLETYILFSGDEDYKLPKTCKSFEINNTRCNEQSIERCVSYYEYKLDYYREKYANDLSKYEKYKIKLDKYKDKYSTKGKWIKEITCSENEVCSNNQISHYIDDEWAYTDNEDTNDNDYDMSKKIMGDSKAFCMPISFPITDPMWEYDCKDIHKQLCGNINSKYDGDAIKEKTCFMLDEMCFTANTCNQLPMESPSCGNGICEYNEGEADVSGTPNCPNCESLRIGSCPEDCSNLSCNYVSIQCIQAPCDPIIQCTNNSTLIGGE